MMVAHLMMIFEVVCSALTISEGFRALQITLGGGSSRFIQCALSVEMLFSVAPIYKQPPKLRDCFPRGLMITGGCSQPYMRPLIPGFRTPGRGPRGGPGQACRRVCAMQAWRPADMGRGEGDRGRRRPWGLLLGGRGP